MVHGSFVRKQCCIFFKFVCLSSVVVYVLSILVSFIPNVYHGPKDGNRHEKVANPVNDILERRTNAVAKDIFTNSSKNISSELHGKVNVHRWYSVCGHLVKNLRKHVLFPKHPKLRTTISRLRINTNLSDFGQRIFGYIHPPLSGFYQFAVSSDDFSEVWLSNDTTPNNTNLICQVDGFTIQGQFDKYESQTSQYIYLKEGRKYYFEVLHQQGEGACHVDVAWKVPGKKFFTIITNEFLSLFVKEKQGHSMEKAKDELFFHEMVLKHHKHSSNKYQPSGEYYKRAEELPLLRLPRTKLPVCNKTEREFKFKLKRYEGIQYGQMPDVYPSDGSAQVLQLCLKPRGQYECKGNPLFDKGRAYSIAQKFFNAAFPKRYSLLSVIRLDFVREKHMKDERYFMELEVYDNVENKTWRVVDHVVAKSGSGSLCYLAPSVLKPDVTVYVIITVKNQGVWIKHFIDNIVDIQEATGDHNIHPIIMDFGSKNFDTGTYLKRSRLKHYSVISKTGKFYKTAAINEAAASVKDNNSIVFLLDLHLDLPVNLFQSVRKHTIQGHMAFVPLLFRLMCGSSPDFPSGHWEDLGFGLFAIYKSDWSRFGGMNAQAFAYRWGGEDWEMMDRVIANNILVHKKKIPGLFHYFHTKKGLWDGFHL